MQARQCASRSSDPVDGEANHVIRLVTPELFFNVRAMRLDGLNAQIEQTRDGFGVVPSSE